MAVVTSRSNVEYDITEYQDKLLDIIKYVDGVCKKHNIRYFLAYGTLLGAIRHHGFIPWDDDADICLLRDEYEKLIKVLMEEKNDRFILTSMENNPDQYETHSKVQDTRTALVSTFSKSQTTQHIFLDVFPIDGIPSSKLLLKLRITYCFFLKAMASIADHKFFVDYERGVWLKKLFKPIADIKGTRYWANKVDKLARKREVKSSKYVAFGAASVWEGRCLKEVYDKAIYVKFEDTELPVPERYEEVLTAQYGDYMTLPPIDKQRPTHLYTVVDLGEKK